MQTEAQEHSFHKGQDLTHQCTQEVRQGYTRDIRFQDPLTLWVVSPPVLHALKEAEFGNL